MVPNNEDILANLQVKIKERSDMNKSLKQLEKPKAFTPKKSFPKGTFKGGVHKKYVKPAETSTSEATPKPTYQKGGFKGGRGGKKTHGKN